MFNPLTFAENIIYLGIYCVQADWACDWPCLYRQ